MNYRSGFVGLVGLPNSGKSTLANAWVGEKVSVISNKPQTTRRRSVGLKTTENSQLILVDAPGFVRAEKGLNRFLQEEFEDVIRSCDVLVAVLNVDESDVRRLEHIIHLVAESGKPWVAVIHKTDLPLAHRPHMLRQRLLDQTPSPGVVEGSSLKQAKALIEDLERLVMSLLPESEGPLYNGELWTLQSPRDLVVEIVREKCFQYLHQEIPYGLAVRILKFSENEGPVVKIFCEILVSKPSHKVMVIGKGGEVLKKVGSAARREIEGWMGRKIYLDLHVTVEKGWTSNAHIMKELGYVSLSQR